MSFDRREFSLDFARETGAEPLRHVPLRACSNFRIGGPADFFFEAGDLASLAAAVRAARRSGLPFRVIGGGFNLLFDDAGFRGLIVKNSARGLSGPADAPLASATSGTPIHDLVDMAAAGGWEGLEFLAGIPGTVGGAVRGNAGAFGSCVADVLTGARLLGRDGLERRVSAADLEFDYRHSALKRTDDIVVEAVFRLRPGDRAAIRARMDECLAVRARKHPPRGTAYAGSYFKNPLLPDGTRAAAGKLLEDVGARGMRIGGALVYEGHCNLVINAGGATAADILALAAELKKRVSDAFGISLEEEVAYLPASPAAA